MDTQQTWQLDFTADDTRLVPLGVEWWQRTLRRIGVLAAGAFPSSSDAERRRLRARCERTVQFVRDGRAGGELPEWLAYFAIVVALESLADQTYNWDWRPAFEARENDLLRAHGFDPEDDFDGMDVLCDEGVPEAIAVCAENDAARKLCAVETFRGYGEQQLADLFERDCGRFDDLREIGRARIFGSLSLPSMPYRRPRDER